MKNKNLNVILIALLVLALQIYGLKFYELADVQMYSSSRVYPYEYISEPTVWVSMLITVSVILISYFRGREK